ncbi:Cephalosporin hydroxylase [Mariprofundus aestuarium]|uniref:Cephalosporin hydroxylase n=1 Tax=Mariprofundus aestuarium TaxID=1921086 RepID=A0A2K8KV20_MARES|nr:CmcI family methyltransferase [Mariprofundus aestuarium]ATX78635.1 Cephalosporin hydroxylase [Mariprofundus aestuarium]
MSLTPLEQYKQEMRERVANYPERDGLQHASRNFFDEIGIGKADYVYNFFWMGVPLIQIPQDVQAMQEIIWEAKPDLIIETGIAWGGSLMFSASMLAVLESCDLVEKPQVLGIDIDIREHNKANILAHPLSKYITMFEGSSIAEEMVERVHAFAKGYKRVMLFLDSNHTHDHVLAELRAYAPLVSEGSYCMVGDTVIEDAPESMVSARPWGKGNSPKSAIRAYLSELAEGDVKGADSKPLRLEIDSQIEHKIAVTGSPDGYLKRVVVGSSSEFER